MTPRSPDPARPLAARVAVITGACSGIGTAAARLLALRGARVALLAESQEQLQEQVAAIHGAGGDAMALAVDVTDQAALDAAHRTIAAEFGVVNLVVNHVGLMLPGSMSEKRTADWERMVSLNLMATLRVLAAFLPSLLEAGAEGCPADLVNVSLVAAQGAYPGVAVYSATQAAISALSRHLRIELGTQDMRVSLIESGMAEAALPIDFANRDTVGGLGGLHPNMYLQQAEDVAEAIAFAVGLARHVSVQRLTLMRTHPPI